MKTTKKLIEVALPLDAINAACAREKSIRHGHPSTLHLWWARRPLAAARAVIFAQMVDDPSEYLDVLRSEPKLRREAERQLKKKLEVWQEARARASKAADSGVPDAALPQPGPEPTLDDVLADLERQRLFKIIEELVKWENTTNEAVLQQARDEIWQSWRRTCAENADHPRAKELFDRHKLPAFHDPFAGGGALPLEAQRLGLEAHASDLNPVAVLINKAMIEIPPKFAGRPPVNPDARKKLDHGKSWKGAQGLAEDVRYYGQWMRDEAEKRIGHLYPRVKVTEMMARERPDLLPYVGRELSVVAWLWARTVKSPNPAFASVDVPLVSTFLLSTRVGKEAYVEPVVSGTAYRFSVNVGPPTDTGRAKSGTKLSRGANFECILSGSPIQARYIRSEAQAGRMGSRVMAIVVQGERERVYLSPVPEHEKVAAAAAPAWKPDLRVPTPCHDVDRLPMYGMPTWGDAFTPRQLVALTTLSDLVREATQRIEDDAGERTPAGKATPLREGGASAAAYAEAVGMYLAFAISKVADRGSSLTRWMPTRDSMYNTFSRQALPMSWDFVEVNSLGEQTGGFAESLRWTAEAIEGTAATQAGHALQLDASVQDLSTGKVVSTDPPYYDNIGYADLSDFFYVWLRRSLGESFPDLFATLAVPKAEELIASPYRHGGKQKAESFFLGGMTAAMRRLAGQAHPAFPVSIYYAFKQSESKVDEGTASTGWETFLDALKEAGFGVSGTWPVRTELGNRLLGKDTNALASSIVLVCRRRAPGGPTATRREFVAALKDELPAALAHLQRGNIAPVDLAQAAIGPGMAVFTRYAKVLDAQGEPMTVREALALINSTLDEALAEQEGDFDADTRWALAWFEQSGFAEGEYGVAETLSKAKNTSVQGLVDAGVLASSRGKVRLLRPDELPDTWDPAKDPRLTAWETVHHLVRTLEAGGETAAAELAAKLGSRAELARELAYRLYTVCERKKRAAEALSYNALVQSFPEITRLAAEGPAAATARPTLFDEPAS